MHISNVYRQALHTHILNSKEASKWLQLTWAQPSSFLFEKVNPSCYYLTLPLKVNLSCYYLSLPLKGQSKRLSSFSTTKRSIQAAIIFHFLLKVNSSCYHLSLPLKGQSKLLSPFSTTKRSIQVAIIFHFC